MINMVVAMWYGIKGRNSFVCLCDIYKCAICLYVYFVSSPYLLVFGDDRVRDTREQMVLRVDLVRLRDGAELDWDGCFGIVVIIYIIKLGYCN